MKRCEKTGHALWDVPDATTGERYNVLVPWEHRHHPAGWGDRPRARWKSKDGDREGVIHARGKAGVIVHDENGGVYVLPNGEYAEASMTAPPSDVRALVKGKKAKKAEGGENKAESKAEGGESKAEGGEKKKEKKEYPKIEGERWITAHPWRKMGNDRGVPVKIVPAGEDKWKIASDNVGGALRHLVLTGIKSPEEYKEDEKNRKSKSREEERRKVSMMSDEERENYRSRKAGFRDSESEKAVRDQERKIVEMIREVAPNHIDADLSPKDLEGMTPGQKKAAIRRHERKQFRQAEKFNRNMRDMLAGKRAREIQARQDVQNLIKQDPELWEKAQLAAADEMQAMSDEREAQKAGKTLKMNLDDAAVRSIFVGASEVVGRHLAELDLGKIKENLDRLGGHKPVDLAEKGPSDEARRRAAEALVDAKHLADEADDTEQEGLDDVTKERKHRIVSKALADAKVDPNDAAKRAEVLKAAAARKLRESERQAVLADHLEELEATPEGRREALAEIATRDVVRKVDEAQPGAAKALGLDPEDEVPVTDAELRAMVDLVGETSKLRKMMRANRAIFDAIDNEDVLKARNAFALAVSEPSKADIEDVMKRADTQAGDQLFARIWNAADKDSTTYASAVLDGSYGAMADVALGITKHSPIDRVVYDALGATNAAFLMRHYLEGKGHDPKTVLKALETHHVKEQERVTNEALKRARMFVPNIEDAVSQAGDITRAAGLLDAHESEIDAAQRAIGGALGQLEALATLGQAFREPLRDKLVIRHRDMDTALASMHAAGLDPGDYTIAGDAIEIPPSSFEKLLPSAAPKSSAVTTEIPQGAGWEKLRMPENATSVDRLKMADRIHKGEFDEDNWLPPGFVTRTPSSLSGDTPAEVAHPLIEPMNLAAGGEDLKATLRKHVGSRLADGEQAHGIAADLFSPEIAKQVPDVAAFHEAVREVLPTSSGGEKTLAANRAIRRQHAELSKKYADAEAAGDERGMQNALNAIRQLPEESVPTMGKNAPDLSDHYAQLAREAAGAKGQSPVAEQSIFHPEADPKQVNEALHRLVVKGGATLAAFLPVGELNASHKKDLRDWFFKKQGVETDPKKADAAWDRFSKQFAGVGGQSRAWQAIQEEVRGEAVESFSKDYARLTGKPIRLGVAALPPGNRATRAPGPVPTPEQAVVEGVSAVRPGQRLTLGARAEGEIAAALGGDFGRTAREGGREVPLFAGASMSGFRIEQQRGIKQLAACGWRMGLHGGTGFGKTATILGSITTGLEAKRIEKGLSIVPPAVFEEFRNAASQFLEPGKYKIDFVQEGEERANALKGDAHMVFMTHQGATRLVRDQVRKHKRWSEEEADEKFAKLTDDQRAEVVRKAAEAAGWPVGKLGTLPDEYHALNVSQGVASQQAMYLRALAHPETSSLFLGGSATPVKNNATEAYSMASLIQPDEFKHREKFERNIGRLIDVVPMAVRRSLDAMTFTAKINPTSARNDIANPSIVGGRKVGTSYLPIDDAHKADIARVEKQFETVTAAREAGTSVPIDAMKEIAPHLFEGQPRDQWQSIADTAAGRLAGSKEHAVRRAVQLAPYESNAKLRGVVSTLEHDSKNKRASIVFAEHTEEGRLVGDTLKDKLGAKVHYYDGTLSTADKDKAKREFLADVKTWQKGGGPMPTMVLSRAGEAGLNMQSVGVIHNYDVPLTMKAWTQRAGRAWRQGQTEEVDIHDWVSDTGYERNAVRRLREKGVIADAMETPLGSLDEKGIAAAYSAALEEQHGSLASIKPQSA